MPQSIFDVLPTTRQFWGSRLRRWLRWGICAGIVAAFVGVTLSVAVSCYVCGPNAYGSGNGNLWAAEPSTPVAEKSSPVELVVMTLNAAHGRADGIHQALLKKQSVEENLDRIGRVLKERSPDVVTLQEADGPSIWSGRFDHVAYLAKAGGYENSYRGEHVNGLKLCYGTALLARYPLDECASLTFDANPPTFPKGFVVGEVLVPGIGPVTVASVHLDFSRKSVRKEQIERLAEELAERPRPMIVMGDFNCDWDDEETLPTLAEQLDLKAFEPESTTTTFPKTGKRLDWIFVSGEIECVDCQVGEDGLSDHQPVIARLRITAK